MSTEAPASPLPRTVRRIIAEAAGLSVDGVSVEIHWTSRCSIEVHVPRRYRSCPADDSAPVNSVRLRIIGRISWYVRDGAIHLNGQVVDVENAFANIAEGRDAYRARRNARTGRFIGRDSSGRFVAGERGGPTSAGA